MVELQAKIVSQEELHRLSSGSFEADVLLLGDLSRSHGESSVVYVYHTEINLVT